METTVISAAAAASSASAGAAGFIAGVSGAIVGNFLFIILFLAIFGVFSYSSDDDTIGWSAFWGVVLAALLGFLHSPMMFVWYMVGCLVVMAIQLTWFDVRNIERQRQRKDKSSMFWTYRWFTYSKHKDGSFELKLDRGSMGRYGVGYVAIAPFLVVHWVFGELIRSVVDVFVDAVRNSLMRRLSKSFDMQTQTTVVKKSNLDVDASQKDYDTHDDTWR